MKLPLFQVFGKLGAVKVEPIYRNVPQLVGAELESKSDVFGDELLLNYLRIDKSVTAAMMEQLGVPTHTYDEFVTEAVLPRIGSESIKRCVSIVRWMLSGPCWKASKSHHTLHICTRSWTSGEKRQ